MSELAKLSSFELDQLALAHGEKYAEERRAGVYNCQSCGNRLYVSDDKFISRVRWPAFRRSVPGSVKEEEDFSFGLRRTSVSCGKCGLHLGHVFGDGKTAGDSHPAAKDRHCVLSICLSFVVDPSFKEVASLASSEVAATTPASPSISAPKKPSKAESILGSEAFSSDSKATKKENSSIKPRSSNGLGWGWTDFALLGSVTVAVTIGAAFAFKFIFGSGDASSPAAPAPSSAPSSSVGPSIAASAINSGVSASKGL